MDLNTPRENIENPVLKIARNATSSYVEVGLVILIIGLFYWFMVLPKQRGLKVQNEQLAKLQDEDKSLADNVAKLQSLIEKLKESKSNVQKLDEALPLKGKTFGINIVLQEYAELAGVILAPANLNTKPDYVIAGNISQLENPFEGKRSLQKLSTNLQVLGTFPKLINFVKKIENSPRLIQINDFQVENGKEGLLNLVMSIDTYFYE